MAIKKILLSGVFIFCHFMPTAANACGIDITADTWLSIINSQDNDKENAYLQQLNNCAVNNPENQEMIDTLSVGIIQVLDRLPADKQTAFMHFSSEALKINANAGYASSQHNYAALFNAPPGSLLAKLIKQDQTTYGYWTKKAAAQSEPRALFDLAMRMAVGVPEAGIAQDQDTAYLIINWLEKHLKKAENTHESAVFQQINPYLDDKKKALIQALGKKHIKALDVRANNFEPSAMVTP